MTTPAPVPAATWLDHLRRLLRLADETDALLWDLVALALGAGLEPAEVAAELGISRATLYRRLAQYRAALEDDPNGLAQE